MKRRKIFIMLMTALAVVCGFGLTACGAQSPEAAVRQSLEEKFEGIKSGKADSDFVKGFMEQAGDQFEPYGIDPDEFMKSYLDGFDYKIGDIKVDEKKGSATADVSITMKPMMDIVSGLTVKMMSAISELPADATEEDFNNLTGKLIMEELANLETKTVDVEIVYNKDDDGTWEPDGESVKKAFTAASLGTSDESTLNALTALSGQGSTEE